MGYFRNSIALKVALLCLSFPVFLSGNAWADDCTEAEIQSYIIDEEATPITALDQCAANVLPVLVELLEDDRTFVRSNAATGLVSFSIGSNNVSAAARTEIVVPALVKALKDDDDYVRVGVVAALSNFSADSKLVIPALVEVFKGDADDEVRLRTVVALVDISFSLQEAKENLSNAELEQSIKDLNEARKAIEQDSTFGNSDFRPLSDPLVELNKELESRRLDNLTAIFSRGWSWFMQRFGVS